MLQHPHWCATQRRVRELLTICCRHTTIALLHRADTAAAAAGCVCCRLQTLLTAAQQHIIATQQHCSLTLKYRAWFHAPPPAQRSSSKS